MKLEKVQETKTFTTDKMKFTLKEIFEGIFVNFIGFLLKNNF